MWFLKISGGLRVEEGSGNWVPFRSFQDIGSQDMRKTGKFRHGQTCVSRVCPTLRFSQKLKGLGRKYIYSRRLLVGLLEWWWEHVPLIQFLFVANPPVVGVQDAQSQGNLQLKGLDRSTVSPSVRLRIYLFVLLIFVLVLSGQLGNLNLLCKYEQHFFFALLGF